MANIFLEETTYLNETELKDSTREEWLKWETEVDSDNRQILIRKSEIIIDSVIWTFWTKENETQETIFPTVENWIPVAIKKAVVLICESMFKAWELTSWASYDWAKWVKSETYWDHKVEFQQEEVQINNLAKKSPYITQEVEILLKPFLTVSTWVKWSKTA